MLAPSEVSIPQKIKVGLYVENLHGIELSKDYFDITFWIWMVHDGTINDIDEK